LWRRRANMCAPLQPAFEIASRVRTRGAIPRIVHKIAPRVHRRRFDRVRDLGLYSGMFETTPRARARGAIMNVVLEIASRVRARGAIPYTMCPRASARMHQNRKARQLCLPRPRQIMRWFWNAAFGGGRSVSAPTDDPALTSHASAPGGCLDAERHYMGASSPVGAHSVRPRA